MDTQIDLRHLPATRAAHGESIMSMCRAIAGLMQTRRFSGVIDAARHLVATHPAFSSHKPCSVEVLFLTHANEEQRHAVSWNRRTRTGSYLIRIALLNESALTHSNIDAGNVLFCLDTALGRKPYRPTSANVLMHQDGPDLEPYRPLPPALRVSAPLQGAGALFGLLVLRAMHRGLTGEEFAEGVGRDDLAALLGKVVEAYARDRDGITAGNLGDNGLGVRQRPETALAAGEGRERGLEMGGAEIRPCHIGEIKFAIGHLPEQEI
jgi:hypothetical protein